MKFHASNILAVGDLVNPNAKSGYSFVRCSPEVSRSKRYQAQGGAGNSNGSGRLPPRWFGPYRRTAIEAAQDYCDYINGRATPAAPAKTWVQPTVNMGTTKRHAPVQTSVPAPERVVHVGPHDLYDVLMTDVRTNTVIRRKVGITAIADKRYLGTAITWGMNIVPLVDAVTYPTKAAAEIAERIRIAEIADDPAWEQVGKECFASIKEMILEND